MTYGGEVWQKAKLNAAGLGSAPHIIVDSKQKGDVISRWYQPNEKVFTVPFPDGSRMVAASICLVDDKAQAFTGMPEQARGYWVQSEELLESQRGEVPASVVPVSSLTDVVEKEKK